MPADAWFSSVSTASGATFDTLAPAADVAGDLERRLEVAVGPTAAGARGEVEEEKVDSKHWVLAALFTKRRRRHEKDAKPSGDAPTPRQPV